MKIYQWSDIHLEFGPVDDPFPTGDVLILAGDITLTNAFDMDSPTFHHRADLRDRTIAFLDRCKASFGRVFYIEGNHEPYDHDINRSTDVIRRQFKQAKLLRDAAFDLGDNTILVGGTLWTDMNGGKDHGVIGKPEGSFRQAAMNDFNIITVERKGVRRTFTTHDAVRRFGRTLEKIEAVAVANPDKTIVVATHHAPSIKGISPEHVNSRYNAGYYTDLHAFIDAHRNILWWTHGHTHLQKAYKVHQCQVISNARGYIGREHSAETFSLDCWFDPVTGKKHIPKPRAAPIDDDLAFTLKAAGIF